MLDIMLTVLMEKHKTLLLANFLVITNFFLCNHFQDLSLGYQYRKDNILLCVRRGAFSVKLSPQSSYFIYHQRSCISHQVRELVRYVSPYVTIFGTFLE